MGLAKNLIIFLMCICSGVFGQKVKSIQRDLVCFGPSGDSVSLTSYEIDSFDVQGRRIRMLHNYYVDEDHMGYVNDKMRTLREYPDSSWSYYYMKYSALPDLSSTVKQDIITKHNDTCAPSGPPQSPFMFGTYANSLIISEERRDDFLVLSTKNIVNNQCLITQQAQYNNRHKFGGSTRTVRYDYQLDNNGRPIKVRSYLNDKILLADSASWRYSSDVTSLTYYSDWSSIRTMYYNQNDSLIGSSTYKRYNKKEVQWTQTDSSSHEYIPGGRLKKITWWKKDSLDMWYISESRIYEFEKGRAEWLTYNDKGVVTFKEESTYDSKHRLIRSVQTKNKVRNQEKVYRYEEDGRSHQCYVYDGKGNLLERWHVVYRYY